MRGARGVAAIVVGAIVLSLQAAGAQAPPTTRAGAPQAPPPSVVAELPPEVQARLDDALLVVAEKAAVLDLLDAFVEPIPPPLRSVIETVEWGTSQSREDLLIELDSLDLDGEAVLDELDGTVALSREVTEVLTATDDDARAQLEQNTPAVLDAGPYLSAIDDLVVRDGGAPLNGGREVIDADALVAAVDAVYAATGDTTATTAAVDTTTPPGGVDSQAAEPSTTGALASPGSTADTSSSGRAWLTIGLGSLVFAALIGALIALRRGRSGASGVQFDELLEVSRTLALARTRDEVERIASREAARLLSGPAPSTTAVLRRSTNALQIGYETLTGVLVPERLDDGLLNRVVETGQSIDSVVTHEPALRSLPASMAAVPIIGAGRVEGVILAVRTPDHPFTEDELGLLRRLGPIAAAALDSARHADASTAASLTDPLTEVGNRRKLEMDLQDALAHASGPTALVMVDLDHFKAVNDAHGHPAGDALLRSVAETLSGVLRPGDAVYRYGGEEFAFVLPATTEQDAAGVAERARESVAARDVDLGDEVLPAPTASLGVAATAGAGDLDGLGVIARADRALYRAKADGRDRVVVATALET